MKEIILIKNGELALKGLNRRTFEDMLIKNMKRRLASAGNFKFTVSQSTIVAEPQEGADLEDAVERIKKIFGIAGFSRAAAVEKDMEVIKQTAAEYLRGELSLCKTFKVIAKRSDKNFPLTSPEICREAVCASRLARR